VRGLRAGESPLVWRGGLRPNIVAVISPRNSLQIILMIVLGRPELGRRDDLRHDRFLPLRLPLRFGALGGLPLLLIVVEDRRTVLRSAVVSLLIQRRRIVKPKEVIEDLIVADLRRIEFDLQRFGMAGASGLHVFVSRLRQCAAGVAHRGVDHTGKLANQLLDTPEASARQSGDLGHLWASCFWNSGRYCPYPSA